MSTAAIRVDNLSKRYRIGTRLTRADTLREALADAFASPFRRLSTRGGKSAHGRSDQRKASEQPDGDHIWALRDTSFEVKQGEVIGIIGRNGAGKSTLLKMLSRITEPTGGRALIQGRVGCLLEVGTGFHPELTGRENVYLSGAIMGMSKTEITRKFDEIVAFSGVAKFIDTPIKRFSSGMHVRLAFAVAAHLEPEILLVDEVLAVGDAEFQRKCLGKMKNVTKEGRTVLFVSHNMAAVRNLCERTLLIEKGCLACDGPTGRVMERYLDHDRPEDGGVVSQQSIESRITQRGWGKGTAPVIRCNDIRLLGPDGMPRCEFQSDEPITLRVTYECWETHSDWRIVASIVDEDNRPILTTQNVDCSQNGDFYQLAPGLYRSYCTFPANLFGERRFWISLRLVFPHIDSITLDKVLGFEVKFLGYNDIQYLSHKETFLRPKLTWRTETIDSNTRPH